MDTRVLEVGDQQLSVAEAGAGGRPFLLLHGFTGAKEDFIEWLDPLAAAGWHALALDHRGHGASSKPASDEAYSFELLAEDALALVDQLGWAEFALLGHSMGGYVAQRMAMAAPERVTALVLMDTSHGGVTGLDPDMVAASFEIVRQGGMDALADVMAQLDGDPLSTPAHRKLVAEHPSYNEFNERKFRMSSPNMFVAMATELGSSTDQLPALAALDPVPPTLVMVGEQDTPFLKPSQRMAEAIPGAELAVIADAGHSPQFENPDGWWNALSGFLAAHVP